MVCFNGISLGKYWECLGSAGALHLFTWYSIGTVPDPLRMIAGMLDDDSSSASSFYRIVLATCFPDVPGAVRRNVIACAAYHSVRARRRDEGVLGVHAAERTARSPPSARARAPRAEESERVKPLGPGSKEVLVVDDVHKSYDGGTSWAVRGVSYALEGGQVVGGRRPLSTPWVPMGGGLRCVGRGVLVRNGDLARSVDGTSGGPVLGKS